jgi:hypothetical protein
MSIRQPRSHRASQGDWVARAVLVLGLATSGGLLLADIGSDSGHGASIAACAPRANAPFAAL